MWGPYLPYLTFSSSFLLGTLRIRQDELPEPGISMLINWQEGGGTVLSASVTRQLR